MYSGSHFWRARPQLISTGFLPFSFSCPCSFLIFVEPRVEVVAWLWRYSYIQQQLLWLWQLGTATATASRFFPFLLPFRSSLLRYIASSNLLDLICNWRWWAPAIYIYIYVADSCDMLWREWVEIHPQTISDLIKVEIHHMIHNKSFLVQFLSSWSSVFRSSLWIVMMCA